MPILKLQQTDLPGHRYRVRVSSDVLTWEHDSEFEFQLSQQDQSDLRWYLEDFLQYPLDPNPQIAARVEQRMAELGAELFDKVFSTREMILLWGRLMDHLSDLRVEVSTSVAAATALPWELLRDPQTNEYLALRAAEFVRSQRDAKQPPKIPQAAEKIRILLVICRPREDQDVPFRSVASHLVRGLNEAARQQVELTVLRPPTFAQLARVLHDAKSQEKPFHVLHFDGHGTYADAEALQKGGFTVEATKFAAKKTGKHGYLLFEDPKSDNNNAFVDGEELGKLLVTTQVPVLVLNACRSAHAESESAEEPSSPLPEGEESFAGGGRPGAFGSLAQEVMDAGVAGVVAMRYNVWVVTAAQFVFELYRHLAGGQSLGAAVSSGRKHLRAEPRRRIAWQDIELQDWQVPVVFEAAPIRLLPRKESAPWGGSFIFDLTQPRRGADALSADSGLPPPPDIGFIGRDDTLLALDRAFDRDNVVLLHAYAGSGKTATAAEFARWYLQTHGTGAVIFSSFESYKPLYQVLGDFGVLFAPLLEANNIQWGALADLSQRRDLALQVLAQIPVLWLWDNIEPVSGFPVGTESAWSAAEQRELVDFLRAARAGKTKFLLTSRREERAWLGDVPVRIAMPPMPMPERAAFAEALAKKSNTRLAVADWRPLLRFSEGNPLTLTVLVKQALRKGLANQAEIAAFVEQLRAGEADFADEDSEKRDRSLAVSLDYGFRQAFAEDEQKILALLVFFQVFLDVRALLIMLQDLGRDAISSRDGISHLLDRAADLGLLSALGGGYYRIHPALPWFFRRLFERFYAAALTPTPLPEGEGPGVRASRAFVAALGELGEYYLRQYSGGNRDVIAALRAEEANLLHAWRLARQHGLWDAVLKAMQGLRVLYDHTGRRAEWAALVQAALPDFVDAGGGPLAGREEQWGLINDYRVRLAREDRDWATAEALQRRKVDWSRQRAAPLLDKPQLDAAERALLRTMAVDTHELGDIRRSLEQPDCVPAYQEALAISEKIGETAGAAVCAFNLGRAYTGIDIPALRDLAQAARWYQRSLDLRAESDRQGRARCLGQLGAVAWERVEEAARAGRMAEANEQAGAALGYYHQALDLLPADAVNDLSAVHNQLGVIYKNIGQLDAALPHYQEDIRLCDESGDFYGAAQTRFNVALALLQAGRRADALAYARAALQGYERYGERARREIEKARGLVARCLNQN